MTVTPGVKVDDPAYVAVVVFVPTSESRAAVALQTAHVEEDVKFPSAIAASVAISGCIPAPPPQRNPNESRNALRDLGKVTFL
jgi:hypothetical protein